MIDIQEAEDGRTIIGDGNILDNIRNAHLAQPKWSYSYVINHHLVQTRRPEGAFDDVCNRLRSKHWMTLERVKAS